MTEKKEKVKLTRIVQFALLADDHDKLAGLKVNLAEFNEQMKVALDAGWCVELMKDSRADAYTVLCKCSAKGTTNAGIGFYARGNTPFSAMVCGLYKISMLGDTDIDIFLSKRGTGNSFG